MFTLVFWKAALERAISTAAQVAVLLIGADMTHWMTLDYFQVITLSLIGGGLTILKSVATGAITDGMPSIGNVELVRPKHIKE